MGDHPSSVTLFSGIMLALYDRERTGRGTKVSTSLIANGAWANSCALQAALCGATFYARTSRKKAGNVLINHYAAKGGSRFILTGIRPNDWQELCRAIERVDLFDDSRFSTAEARTEHSEELIAILDAVFGEKTREKWGERFERHGVAWAPVLTNTDLPDDEQMRETGVFVEADEPGVKSSRLINSPIWLRSATKVKPTPPPQIGQHTREVLAAAGYTEREVAGLLDSGAASATGVKTPSN
jgi:crotonobetainyl-CoA:carnitine CoA-transferase CaiB-like acyl-CoA transferase